MKHNKIYARANEGGVVTRIFSEEFENPCDSDICIDDVNTDRHGANKYQVYDEYGVANYAIEDGTLVERDKCADIMIMRKREQIAELKQRLAETDYQAIKFAEGEMSAEEFAAVKEQRVEWRKQINELEELL